MNYNFSYYFCSRNLKQMIMERNNFLTLMARTATKTRIFVAILVIGLVATSCTKEDSVQPAKEYFTLIPQHYSLTLFISA